MRHTANSINAQIAKATSLPIRVAWDGDETREYPLFAVWFGDEPADYTVEDLGHTFDVDRQIGPRHYESVGGASDLDSLALVLLFSIKGDIDAGLLEEHA